MKEQVASRHTAVSFF